jgi:5S rRNA maturation endonuclease (ribonuclease M5)
MLHGSIQGGIFSTSSTTQVKKTIDHIIQGQKDKQIIVLTKHYISDRYNYMAAVTMAQALNPSSNIKVIDIGDDLHREET